MALFRLLVFLRGAIVFIFPGSEVRLFVLVHVVFMSFLRALFIFSYIAWRFFIFAYFCRALKEIIS